MWLLKTPENADPPLTFRLGQGSVKTIGRGTRADFVVDAALVSRLHCRVSAGATELEIVDLESTNGTYLNGRRVSRASARGGDRLRIGRVELLVERADAPAPASEPGTPLREPEESTDT